MDILLFLFVGAAAFVLILFVVEPYRFIPEGKGKAKRVGSSYWGIYEGAQVEDLKGVEGVEIRKPARKHIYTAGSATYAAGRGVNMSGK